MDVEEGNSDGITAEEGKTKKYGLSLNKLADNYALNTIRIKERCQRRDIVIYLSNIDGKKKNNTWRSYVELNSFIIKNSY